MCETCSKEEDACPICLEKLSGSYLTQPIWKCNHINFHPFCLYNWKGDCPLCRDPRIKRMDGGYTYNIRISNTPHITITPKLYKWNKKNCNFNINQEEHELNFTKPNDKVIIQCSCGEQEEYDWVG